MFRTLFFGKKTGITPFPVVAFFLLAALLMSSRVFGAGQTAKTFVWREGKAVVKLDYLVSSPSAWAGQKPPVMLFLHGSGERGTNLEAVKVHGPPKVIEHGRDLPFIVISPQCPPNQHWSDTNILSCLAALVDQVVRDRNADPERIYLTGLSMGGFGAWRLASLYPDKFAAVAPICGGGDPVTASNLRSLPVWVFHGLQDPVVAVSMASQMIAALSPFDPNLRSTIYPDLGHDSWTVTYGNPELYTWMLGWEKGAKRSGIPVPQALKDSFGIWELEYRYKTRVDDSSVKFDPSAPMSYRLTRKNSSSRPVQETVRWLPTPGNRWIVNPPIVGISLNPGETRTYSFTLTFKGGRNEFCVPSWQSIVFLANERWTQSTQAVRMDADEYLSLHPLVAECRSLPAPVIDGEPSDKAWQKAAVNQDFRTPDGRARYGTRFRTCHDKVNLYLLVECVQSNLATLVTRKTQQDANLWEDDSAEVFIAPVPGQRPYYQFVVNSAGWLYDANVWDRGWNSSAKVQTGMTGDGWIVEMAIPFSSLGISPRKGLSPGFEVSRNHETPPESSQWCPTFAGNHAFQRYGRLDLK